MHKELEKLLDEVWDERRTLLEAAKKQGFMEGRGASAGMKNAGVARIYRMYSDIRGGSSSKRSHLVAMKRELVKLESTIDKPPEVQGDNKQWDYQILGWMANADLDELRSKFFHYRKSRSAAVYRIYINTTPASRGALFRGILCDYGVWDVNGLSNAKLSSPDDPRADAIIIYLRTEKATELALARIAQYHKANKGDFCGILPKLVEHAKSGTYRMDGVGVAMEPPGFRLVSTGGNLYHIKTGQSFGSYRAELIYMALERTRLKVENQSERQRKTAFKNRVEKYFRHAGIDPDHPAHQSPIKPLPLLGTLVGWANTTDRKPL